MDDRRKNEPTASWSDGTGAHDDQLDRTSGRSPEPRPRRQRVFLPNQEEKPTGSTGGVYPTPLSAQSQQPLWNLSEEDAPPLFPMADQGSTPPGYSPALAEANRYRPKPPRRGLASLLSFFGRLFKGRPLVHGLNLEDNPPEDDAQPKQTGRSQEKEEPPTDHHPPPGSPPEGSGATPLVLIPPEAITPLSEEEYHLEILKVTEALTPSGAFAAAPPPGSVAAGQPAQPDVAADISLQPVRSSRPQREVSSSRWPSIAVLDRVDPLADTLVSSQGRRAVELDQPLAPDGNLHFPHRVEPRTNVTEISAGPLAQPDQGPFPYPFEDPARSKVSKAPPPGERGTGPLTPRYWQTAPTARPPATMDTLLSSPPAQGSGEPPFPHPLAELFSEPPNETDTGLSGGVFALPGDSPAGQSALPGALAELFAQPPPHPYTPPIPARKEGETGPLAAPEGEPAHPPLPGTEGEALEGQKPAFSPAPAALPDDLAGEPDQQEELTPVIPLLGHPTPPLPGAPSKPVPVATTFTGDQPRLEIDPLHRDQITSQRVESPLLPEPLETLGPQAGGIPHRTVTGEQPLMAFEGELPDLPQETGRGTSRGPTAYPLTGMVTITESGDLAIHLDTEDLTTTRLNAAIAVVRPVMDRTRIITLWDDQEVALLQLVSAALYLRHRWSHLLVILPADEIARTLRQEQVTAELPVADSASASSADGHPGRSLESEEAIGNKWEQPISRDAGGQGPLPGTAPTEVHWQRQMAGVIVEIRFEDGLYLGQFPIRR